MGEEYDLLDHRASPGFWGTTGTAPNAVTQAAGTPGAVTGSSLG